MINKYQPHVLVLPEDDANRQLANGFLLELDISVLSRIQVLPEVGGWRAVLDNFASDHVTGMDRYADRHMILLIDCDGVAGRVGEAKQRIPARMSNRVFILGAWTEPEELKGAGLGAYEAIGRAAAADCREQTNTIWGHILLRHNASEIDRLRQHVAARLRRV